MGNLCAVWGSQTYSGWWIRYNAVLCTLNLVVISMLKFSRLFLLVVLSGLISQAWAADLDQAREAIQKRFDEVKAENIQPSPVEGLYRVTVPPQVFYVSADGRYVFDGNVIDMQVRRNLTQEYRDQAVLKAVDEMGEESMIVFAADKPEHVVTVFTDIDCGYCRKLHEHVDAYNKQGITIRYMAYPRAGLNSNSYDKAVSVWCAEDRQKAITAAKQGKPVQSQSCDNPVADQYKLGQRIGVSGTPALVLDTGQLIPGYIPPKRLAAILNREPMANGN